MRIEHIEAFLAVAQAGSFQKASVDCGVTQSTVSRQVQALEKQLGLPLLHRNGQIKLTLAGEQFFPRAQKIMTEWNNARKDIDQLLSGKLPELCVAAIHSVCSHYLPPVLQQFCELYPQVQLRVTSLGSDRSLKVLRDGLVDLAIVMDNPLLTQTPEMVVDLLYQEKIQVLMSAKHPLTAYDLVPWQVLAQYPQAMFKDGYGMQRLVQAQFQAHGLELNAALELNTLDAFRGVMRQGNMVSLLPQGALFEAQSDQTLAIRDLADVSANSLMMPLSRDVVMVTTTDRLLIPPIANFRRLVKDCFHQKLLSPRLPLQECLNVEHGVS